MHPAGNPIPNALVPVALTLLLCAVTHCAADAPQTAAGQSQSPSQIVFDQKAEALLKASAAAQALIRSAVVEEEWREQVQIVGHPMLESRYLHTVRLLKPRYGYYELRTLRLNPTTRIWEQDEPSVTASDGVNVTNLITPKFYEQRPAKADGSNVPAGVNALAGFFAPADTYIGRVLTLQRKGELTALRYIGPETWQGEPAETVLYAQKGVNVDGDAITKSVRLTMTTRDHLVHRFIEEWESMGNHIHSERIVRRLQLNPPFTPGEFAYTPPPGAQLPPPPAPEIPLLENGSVAPDFTVYTADGRPLKLSDYRGKVVVLDFWATWCYPCIRSLPHTNALAAGSKAQNLVILAIDASDPHKNFADWIKAHSELNALTFALAGKEGEAEAGKQLGTLYHVNGIPTQYIIDSAGKIVEALVGYGGDKDKRLEAALQKAGIRQPR